jgi:hypothetical protein
MNRFPFTASHEKSPDVQTQGSLQPGLQLTFDELSLEFDPKANAVSTERDSGLSKGALLLGVFAIGAASFVGIRVADNVDFNFRGPDIGLDDALVTSPPVLEAEVMHPTIEIRGTFEMLAIADVTMGVEIEGYKEGLGIDFTGITDADYSKDLWMRMGLTTDNKQINDSLVVTKQNDKVLGVRAAINVADIFMPHINYFDFRNFIKLRPGDTQEEIDKKIYEFVTESGKHYDTSGGFSCGACSTGAAELFSASGLAAMYAVSVDGRQPDVVDRMTKTYQLNLQSQLAAEYELPLDKVDIEIIYDDGTNPLEPPTPEEVKAIYQKRLDDLYQENFAAITIKNEGVEMLVDVGAVLFEVKPELRYDDDNEPFVYLQLHGGAELTIKLSGITLDENIRMAIISNIDEFEERVVNDISTNSATESNQSPIPIINSNGGVGTEEYGPPVPIINSNGGVGTEEYGPPTPISSGD